MKKIFGFAAVLFFALNSSIIFAQAGTVYHLLILDRTNSPLNSDIGDVTNATLLYKYRHDRNGYIVALYASSQQGPLSPRLPSGSRIVANMSTAHRVGIRDYINSSAFRRFVTNRTVTAQLLRAL